MNNNPQIKKKNLVILTLFLFIKYHIMEDQRVVLSVYSEAVQLLLHARARIKHVVWYADEHIFIDFVYPQRAQVNSRRHIEHRTPTHSVRNI